MSYGIIPYGTGPYGGVLWAGQVMGDTKNLGDVIRALLPPGAIWVPANGQDFDLLIDAMGENCKREVYDIFKTLASIRDPKLTPILSDLEKEYGILTDLRLTDDERRQALFNLAYAKPGNGSDTDLQAALHDAGFTNAYVYQNSPAVDPDNYLSGAVEMVAGGDIAYAGYTDSAGKAAVANYGAANGILIVNTGISEEGIYPIPSGPDRWNYVWFIGGLATKWTPLDDWDMELPGTQYWTSSAGTILSKDTVIKNSGVRSLKVIHSNNTVQQEVYPAQQDPNLLLNFRTLDHGDNKIYNAAWKNFLADGNMEASGTGSYTQVNNAILSKSTSTPFSGLQSLDIAYNGTALPGAKQSVLTIGYKYKIKGYARNVSGGSPVVRQGGVAIWTGTTSTAWQAFEVIFTAAVDTDIILSTDLAAAGTIGYDDVHIALWDNLADSDAETAGVGSWSVGNSATLTKESGFRTYGQGTQVLRVAYNGTTDPYAYQSVLTSDVYRIKGWARSDGSAIPEIRYGSTVIWTGTTTLDWQYFDIIGTSTSAELRFYAKTSAAGYCDFDDIEFVPTYSGNTGTNATADNQYSGYGPVLDFDGGDNVKTGNGPYVAQDFAGGFTAGMYIKIASIPSAQEFFFDQMGRARLSVLSSGKIRGEIYDSGIADFRVVDSDDPILPHLWYQVYLVYEPGSPAYVKLYINGVVQTDVENITSPVLVDATKPICIGSENDSTDYFTGLIFNPEIYAEGKGSFFIVVRYSDDLLAFTAGDYAEQTIPESITDDRTITGFAWGDGLGNIPVLMVQRPNGFWDDIWAGTNSGAKQSISGVTYNDAIAIRLYSKFMPAGVANWDDIDITDPTIPVIDIESERMAAFRNVVLRYKPLHSWCVAMVQEV